MWRRKKDDRPWCKTYRDGKTVVFAEILLKQPGVIEMLRKMAAVRFEESSR